MFKRMMKRFKRNENGQGMVEYGLILALVSVVAIGALSGIGGSVSEKFEEVVNVMYEPVIVKGDPVYSEDEIDNLVNEDYIPIANFEDMNNLRKAEVQTFAKGTKWEKEYTSGLDKKYIQVSDIDLSGKKSFDPSGIKDFEPIGNKDNPFTGSFDGGGHTLNNLNINKVDDSNVGLFGSTKGSTFKNIGLENVDVKGGEEHIGGLVGLQDRSTIDNSYVKGKVKGQMKMADTGRYTGSYTGGLVGKNYNMSRVTNSYASAQVTGRYNVGGLVGGQSHSSSVTNSYATGQVTGTAGSVGGLIGQISWESSIGNCYATGKVTGDGDFVGGVVGLVNSGGGYKVGAWARNSGWATDVNPNLEGLGGSLNGGRSSNIVGHSKAEIDEIIKGLFK